MPGPSALGLDPDAASPPTATFPILILCRAARHTRPGVNHTEAILAVPRGFCRSAESSVGAASQNLQASPGEQEAGVP